MVPLSLLSFLPALPEISLVFGSIVLLMLGVFRKKAGDGVPSPAVQTIPLATALLLVLNVFFLFLLWPEGATELFNGAFISDSFSFFIKIPILLSSLVILFMARCFLEREGDSQFEFYVILGFSVAGAMMMVSAGDLISLYMAMEIQALSLYILAASCRDSLRSTEAGLKYLVLGALASGMMLYGFSLIYGFTGTVAFSGIRHVLDQGDLSIGLIFGLVFFFVGMAFKLSAVPFHMWTPDVYVGAPSPVVALFATVPKIAAVALLIRMTVTVFPALILQWQPIFLLLAIASMVWGAIAGVVEKNIKRLMAYSSIGHMGILLLGLSAGTQTATESAILYLLIYTVTTLGIFSCILVMYRDRVPLEHITDFSGIAEREPMFAFCFSLLLFSLAGIPPLFGFFAKFYVFSAAIESEMYISASIGVLSSVVSAYYYLRIIKIMYFDEKTDAFERMPAVLKGILLLSALISVVGSVFLGKLVDIVTAITWSLF